MTLQEFLAKTQQLYEMHIYTHGNAEYAVEMAKLLDPSKRFFAERIISQVSSCDAAKSKAKKDGLPWQGYRVLIRDWLSLQHLFLMCNNMLVKHIEHHRGVHTHMRPAAGQKEA